LVGSYPSREESAPGGVERGDLAAGEYELIECDWIRVLSAMIMMFGYIDTAIPG
jgi:hypothetical protein